jgi:hypothetical protein
MHATAVIFSNKSANGSFYSPVDLHPARFASKPILHGRYAGMAGNRSIQSRFCGGAPSDCNPRRDAEDRMRQRNAGPRPACGKSRNDSKGHSVSGSIAFQPPAPYRTRKPQACCLSRRDAWGKAPALPVLG